MARPPDKSNVAPVVKLHSGLATHATIAAISSILRKRPIGIFAFPAAMCSAVISLKRSVSVITGAIALTRTFDGDSSFASDLVNAMTPPFAAA